MQECYHTEKNKSKNVIRSAIQNQSFSLLIDKWKNFEHNSFLTVSVSYATNKQTIKTAYWLTMSSPNTVDELQQHLVELNVKLCAAVVVNFDICEEMALQEFITINGLTLQHIGFLLNPNIVIFLNSTSSG